MLFLNKNYENQTEYKVYGLEKSGNTGPTQPDKIFKPNLPAQFPKSPSKNGRDTE